MLNATVYQHSAATTEKSTSAAVCRSKSWPDVNRLRCGTSQNSGAAAISNVVHAECCGLSTFPGKYPSGNFSRFADQNVSWRRRRRLRDGWNGVEGRSHLREDLVEPLQWAVEVDLDPARRARDVLAMVLGAPALHKAHADRAHLGEFEHGAVAVVHRLKSRHKQLVKVIWHKTASPPETVQSYLPGGNNVPTWEGTLVPPGEYDWTVGLWQWCNLMSNYFDHLL